MSGVEVRLLDGPGAVVVEDRLRGMYEEAFAEPPYTDERIDAGRAFRRFRSQAEREGFRAAVAFDGGVVVGMAFGYPLAARTGWWNTLTSPVSEETRREDGRRTFGLFELAVRPGWRRRGVATALHRELVAGLENERVMLNARPDAAAARAAYRSWGYRPVGTAIPWQGAVLHEIMVLDL